MEPNRRADGEHVSNVVLVILLFDRLLGPSFILSAFYNHYFKLTEACLSYSRTAQPALEL
jgi:hypothetical protein